jgi:hypothetical protein
MIQRHPNTPRALAQRPPSEQSSASVSDTPSTKASAREAALRYASDPGFAAEFDLALSECFENQTKQLSRLAQRLGLESTGWQPPKEGRSRLALSERTDLDPLRRVTPSAVTALLRERAGEALTRGEIALGLGVDSRDLTLTRALSTSKKQGLVRQRGSRRAARYSLATSDKPLKRGARR